MAQRRILTSQILTLYAWIATQHGSESVVSVDVPTPTGPRTVQLVSANRAEAWRYAPHARRYLAALEANDVPARVDLRTFTRAQEPKEQRMPRAARKRQKDP